MPGRTLQKCFDSGEHHLKHGQTTAESLPGQKVAYNEEISQPRTINPGLGGRARETSGHWGRIIFVLLSFDFRA